MWSFMVRSRRRLSTFLAIAVLGLAVALVPVAGSAATPIRATTLASRLEMPQLLLLLDVRSPTEYAAGHIPGAINLPSGELPARVGELQRYTAYEIVVYCEVGVRAGLAERLLAQAGFEKILTLEGQMQGWRQAGFPLERLNPPMTPQIQEKS
ncbi:MAG TPA: rhodanese-like domain-containing protein [Candidatus Obscuribacterales bacterium]